MEIVGSIHVQCHRLHRHYAGGHVVEMDERLYGKNDARE
jgi:hypothetical protein